MSYQRFCLLASSANVPDRNTLWQFQQRLGEQGATALFQGVDNQLHRHGYLARYGQIIDATLVNAPIGHCTKEDKQQLEQGDNPADWNAAKRRQKDLHASHTKKHGKGYHGYKLSINVDVRPKFVRKITTGTVSEHDSRHFDDVLDEHNTSGPPSIFGGRCSWPCSSPQNSLTLHGMALESKPLNSSRVESPRLGETSYGSHPSLSACNPGIWRNLLWA